MTNLDDRLLELWVRLLILRYGREKVAGLVAALGEQSVDEVDREIVAAERAKKAKPRGLGRSAGALAIKGPPEVRALVSALVDGYRKRVFLPRLHDVERFLDHASVHHGRLKSRTEALPKVVRVLSQLSKNQLERLDRNAGVQGESDFALLAEEIVGGRKTTTRHDQGRSNREAPPS